MRPWFPWRFAIRWLSRRHGFIDPASLLSTLHNFAHPSEVAVPIELLRAGVVFHARGLINTKAIQQNLDWVWPYWVTQQFDPLSDSFLPRAFSITHVNLTHRNWTAVGLPDCESLPIVDPRGLVTPLYDGWSLDGWIVTGAGRELLPSRARAAEQRLLMSDDDFAIRTVVEEHGLRLKSETRAVQNGGIPECEIEYTAAASENAWLCIALRPCNPEGVSFIPAIQLNEKRNAWAIGGETAVYFDTPVERSVASIYHDGDIHPNLLDGPETDHVTCNVGLATAAAMYRITPGQERRVSVRVPLDIMEEHKGAEVDLKPPMTWPQALAPACRASLPNRQLQYLYDAAVRTLILHAPGEVYPGPYTYKRFWFRDTAFIVNTLLALGFVDRVERVLNSFPARQNLAGFFHSQDGEWDSNGEAIWILHRFGLFTGREPKPEWRKPVLRGARWIQRKRTPNNLDAPHAGLLPAGFSAEHLGNNDYYYWDDFWGVAGLQAAAAMARAWGDVKSQRAFEAEAADLFNAIVRSLKRTAKNHPPTAIPASPYRRMDAGAVGSIVAGYPLTILPPDDPRLLGTLEFLLKNQCVHGAFFQDMIHSGINPYLTLQMAQVLLRAGDARWLELLQAVADLASPTGQWPEAVHPRTKGGCMGDGQHAWAAAEWAQMIRNLFVREEEDRLILASGCHPDLLGGPEASFGPTLTPWGPVTVHVDQQPGQTTVRWDAQWREFPPTLEVALPGHEPLAANPQDTNEVTFQTPSRHVPGPAEQTTGS